MKLDDVRRLMEVVMPLTPESQQKIHEHMISIGIDPSNLYQELEMSSPFVNTHRDVTYTPHPVSLHSHSYIEILYCHNATGVEYLVGPDRYKLQQGDIILIPPGISHRPILPEIMTEPYVRDVLWVNAEFLASLEQAFPRSAAARISSSLYSAKTSPKRIFSSAVSAYLPKSWKIMPYIE